MTAYYIGKFDIIDEPRFDEYVGKVMPLIAKHDGQVVVGNKSARGVEGPKPGMNIVIRFPSEEAAMAFYDDPEYQPVKQIRLLATANNSAVVSPAFEY